MLFEFEFEVLGRLLCLCTSSHAWACKPPRSLPNDRIILPNPPIFRSRVMCVRTLRTTSETGTVQQPGWGIAVCGLCSVVALCWWAGVCCVCLWWFPALVHACLCIPNHRVRNTHNGNGSVVFRVVLNAWDDNRCWASKYPGMLLHILQCCTARTLQGI